MPPIETFIELEGQLSQILHQRWQAALAHGWPSIKASWDAGHHDTAIALTGSLNVGPLHSAQDRRIRALCQAMLAYGAQHVSKREAAKWFDPKADLEPVDLMMRQLVVLAEQDTPAFAVRLLQAEAKRQAREALGEEDLKVLTEQDRYATLFAKADGDLGPSSYRARNIILSGGKWSSDLTANLTTSRLVNYGSLNAMRNVGIRRYRIRATMDAKTSPICDSMNNRVFHVVDGFDILGRALRSQNGNALRVDHPWIPWSRADEVRHMSEAQLRANRWVVPPFHPSCRSIIVPAGKTTRRVSQGTTVRSLQPGALAGDTPATHPQLSAQGALDVATSLPVFDMVEGGVIMRALRQVGHMLPLHSWEIDALGDLIGLTLERQAVAGRISAAEAEQIITGLVRRAVPPGSAEGAVMDALMAEVRAGTGNEAGWFAGGGH